MLTCRASSLSFSSNAYLICPFLALFVTLVAAPIAIGQSELQMETVRKIRGNESPTFGTWVYLKEPAITEMLVGIGYDWVIIDMEHTVLSEDHVQSLILPMAGTGCVPIVRIPENHKGVINRVLDSGVLGILVPFVYNREDAERAVRYARYPPEGSRGIGYARAQGWGQKVQKYLERANEAVLVGLIIETREAVENLDEILQVPGIDFILAGTFDLSGSYGVLGQFDHPSVIQARKSIEEAARKWNKPIVSWSLDREGLEDAVRSGSKMISLGGDVDWLAGGATELLNLAKDVTRP